MRRVAMILHKEVIIGIVVRGLAGSLPLFFALFVPYLLGPSKSAGYFADFSKVLLMATIFRLGQDIILLKSYHSTRKLVQIFYVQLVNSFIVLSIAYFIDFSLLCTLAVVVVSLNAIVSFYFLTRNKKTMSVLVLYVAPFILMTLQLMFFDEWNPYIVILISHLLPISYLLSKVLRLLYNYFGRIYYNIGTINIRIYTYTILSVLLNTLPVIIAKNFGDENQTIELFKVLKFIGISSFISSLITFNFNDLLRNLKSYHFVMKLLQFLPICILVFTIVTMIFYAFEIFKANYLLYIGINFVMITLFYGNIVGYFNNLHSLEHINFYAILIPIVVLVAYVSALYLSDIELPNILYLVLVLLSFEAIFKVTSIIIRNRDV